MYSYGDIRSSPPLLRQWRVVCAADAIDFAGVTIECGAVAIDFAGIAIEYAAVAINIAGITIDDGALAIDVARITTECGAVATDVADVTIDVARIHIEAALPPQDDAGWHQTPGDWTVEPQGKQCHVEDAAIIAERRTAG